MNIYKYAQEMNINFSRNYGIVSKLYSKTFIETNLLRNGIVNVAKYDLPQLITCLRRNLTRPT